MARPCKDCVNAGIGTHRPVLENYPGPRCATHARRHHREVAARAAERRVANTYGMTQEQYARLYELQGGHCAICQAATGKARRLAVDHDHKKGCGHPPEQGCIRCWRGLLCKRCNQLIAWNSPEVLARAIEYLADPPAQRILNPGTTVWTMGVT